MGDFEDAFEGLYRLAYRVAFRLIGHRGEAEDVAAEALARTYVRWSRVGAYPEAWVSRVSTNLALDAWRKERRRSHTFAVPPVIDAEPVVADQSPAESSPSVAVASHASSASPPSPIVPPTF